MNSAQVYMAFCKYPCTNMNKIGILTSVLPLGEGAAKPGIEWPEGTQSALANYGSLFHKPTKCFIPLGVSIPLVFPLLQGETLLTVYPTIIFSKK